MDTEGALHHVMVRGLESREIFLSEEDRKDIVHRLTEIAPKTGTVIYAWSLLSNHFHLLLRTGKDSISKVMRRLLTGYAVSFNRRHKRVGHLFQNRYKSILVEEEPYFLQLVRYIHLNPLRAGLVMDVNALDNWPWSGHSALMGRKEYAFQDKEYVLSRFGRTRAEACRAYREFVVAGIHEGRRPDLTGGGLIRSLGGRGASRGVPRRGRERWAYDERVLGSSEFVMEVLEETRKRQCYDPPRSEQRKETLDHIIARVGTKLGLSREEITGGSRRRAVATGRYLVGYLAVGKHGHPVAEVARELKVSSQSVLRALEKGPQLLKDLGWEEKRSRK
ncbi:MAG: transposase [bacterium]